MIGMMLPRRPSPVDSRLRGNDGGVASEWRGAIPPFVYVRGLGGCLFACLPPVHPVHPLLLCRFFGLRSFASPYASEGDGPSSPSPVDSRLRENDGAVRESVLVGG